MRFISQKKALEVLMSDPGARVVLPGRYQDGTSNNRPVWLEDGELVYRHPTDSKRGSVHVSPDDRLAID